MKTSVTICRGGLFRLDLPSRVGGIAIGRPVADGFVVFAGSAVNDCSPDFKTRPRVAGDTYARLRERLETAGVIVTDPSGGRLGGRRFVLTQDWAFSCRAAASSVVLGRSSDGNDWKPLSAL